MGGRESRGEEEQWKARRKSRTFPIIFFSQFIFLPWQRNEQWVASPIKLDV